uniref:homeobox protein Hox-B2 n=1 Tax=Lonchura striata TaxID=40157 RepID=UPI000B4D4CEF|nr:homeobox protein Hox-B2 [Lonchura striata domestica]
MGKEALPDSGGSRRLRSACTNWQLLELEEEFQFKQNVCRPRRVEIAALPELSERRVKVWVQNRRVKHKRRRRHRLDCWQNTAIAWRQLSGEYADERRVEEILILRCGGKGDVFAEELLEALEILDRAWESSLEEKPSGNGA